MKDEAVMTKRTTLAALGAIAGAIVLAPLIPAVALLGMNQK